MNDDTNNHMGGNGGPNEHCQRVFFFRFPPFFNLQTHAPKKFVGVCLGFSNEKKYIFSVDIIFDLALYVL